jgi:hypothetical protein
MYMTMWPSNHSCEEASWLLKVLLLCHHWPYPAHAQTHADVFLCGLQVSAVHEQLDELQVQAGGVPVGTAAEVRRMAVLAGPSLAGPRLAYSSNAVDTGRMHCQCDALLPCHGTECFASARSTLCLERLSLLVKTHAAGSGWEPSCGMHATSAHPETRPRQMPTASCNCTPDLSQAQGMAVCLVAQLSPQTLPGA